MNLLRLCDANIFRISSLLIPPPPCLSLGLKTEEGNAVCVWMKLKLEAEWHCSGTGKSSRLPACVCVCMLVMDGGVMRKGASKLFHLGGHSSANKTSNVIPPKTIPHTHTGTGRYPQRDKHAACPTQSSRKQQKAADLQWAHSGLQMLLKPQKRIFPSHSTTLCLNSQHTDTKVTHENKLYKHP